MTAAVPGAAIRPRHRASAGGDTDGRGRTSIADRVVTKIAAQACTEVDHVHGLTPALTGRVLGQDSTVSVQADIDGHLAQLRVQIAVDYPVSLRAVTRELRAHVRARVGQLCALTVTDMDIRITELRYSTEPVRRVL
ncbi:MAG TPA: Asp23/Gls24 family envelope stress response protein [Nakamurella sp.]|nr:Asp23/Gls24 family envelope stress response protein [Nakamurella sp.]